MRTKLAIALCVLSALPSYGWAAFSYTPAEQEIITKTDTIIMEVSVDSIINENPTNGNPPQTKLKLLQVMRGEKIPTGLQAVWDPMPSDFAWAGEGAAKKLEIWNSQPLSSPAQGSKWFVTGRLKDKTLHISPLARYPSSNDASRWIMKRLSDNVKSEFRGPFADDQKIIENEARLQRIEPWARAMDKSDSTALAGKSDLVAVATIATMEHDKRLVEFAATQVIKAPPTQPTGIPIKLMGLPDDLYSVLYDYTKLSGDTPPHFLLFMKTRKGAASYIPTSAGSAIQPATPEKLKGLSVAEKTISLTDTQQRPTPP